MARRGQPGHSHRLVAERLASGTAMAGAVNDYLAAIGAKGFSPYTVAYRSRSLGHLVAWLAERGVSHPAEVTKPVLERYQRSLFHYRKADGNPLSFRSQVSYLVPVKALFKWLAQTNRILFNPASELELPRIERRLPKVVLNVGEVEAVLAGADLDEPVGLRDRAIMEVLYSTGIRRSELAHLRLHDVDVDRGTVTVDQGQGRKDRVVPIGERALAWVDRYVVEVRPLFVVPPDDTIMFLTVEGNDLTPDHLSERIGRYVRQATGKPGSCHTFRHSMATLMLEGGADIRHIQEILGHAQLTTTRSTPTSPSTPSKRSTPAAIPAPPTPATEAPRLLRAHPSPAPSGVSLHRQHDYGARSHSQRRRTTRHHQAPSGSTRQRANCSPPLTPKLSKKLERTMIKFKDRAPPMSPDRCPTPVELRFAIDTADTPLAYPAVTHPDPEIIEQLDVELSGPGLLTTLVLPVADARSWAGELFMAGVGRLPRSHRRPPRPQRPRAR